MCLILFAWQAHPRYELVLAANRDEFHTRPTAPADFWPDPDPDPILAGRDLQAGGTWLGVRRDGRFAAVTNFREPLAPEPPLERSRGELVTGYLRARSSPLEHARALAADAGAYRGFNLLLGARGELVHASNRQSGPAPVEAGVHGLSNHLLDTDWPKVHAGRTRLQDLLAAGQIEADDLLELLADRGEAPGAMPVEAGDGAVRRHLMNHSFILSPVYGTRSSTVLLIERGGAACFVERRFAPDGVITGTSRFAL